jgi:polyisoprenoid-binding protein YceI
MKKLLLACATLYTLSYGGGCLLTQPKEITVGWEAYKTLGKIGVNGTFTSVDYRPASLEGKNFKELFVGATVSIDTSKLDTGNPDRDLKLVQFFFKKMTSEAIMGKIESIVADPRKKGEARTGTLTVAITMNGKTLPIPMRYRYDKGAFDAVGTIDLGDFAALPALSSINKSCYELHKGKTWRDVTISFHTTVNATLCDSGLGKTTKK